MAVLYIGNIKIRSIDDINGIDGINFISLLDSYFKGEFLSWLKDNKENKEYYKKIKKLSKESECVVVNELRQMFHIEETFAIISSQREFNEFIYNNKNISFAIILNGTYELKDNPFESSEDNKYFFAKESDDKPIIKVGYSFKDSIKHKIDIKNITITFCDNNDNDIYMHGNDIYKMGEYEEALLMYERIENKFFTPDIMLKMACCNHKLGNFDEALNCLDSIHGADEIMGEVNYIKYEYLKEINKDKDADDCLKKAVEFENINAIRVYAEKKLYSDDENEKKEAISYMEKMAPNNGEISLKLAECYLAGNGVKKDIDKAEGYFSNAESLLSYERKTAAYKGLGKICEIKKNIKAAVGYYRRTTDTECLKKAAKYYIDENNYDAAIEMYEKSVKCGYANGYADIAERLFKLNDKESKNKGKEYVIKFVEEKNGNKKRKEKLLEKYLKYYRKDERNSNEKKNTKHLERIAKDNGIKVSRNIVETIDNANYDPLKRGAKKVGKGLGWLATVSAPVILPWAFKKFKK